MGVVYEAVDEALGRTVALKVVAPERAGEPGFRERFITESRLAASIDHPNVLPVFKAGEEDGELYLAMRFVDGDDLRTLVDRDGPLAPERAAHIAAQIGAALDAAHARRLIHRDVKPANVLVGEGDHAYLTDFGVVKALDETSGQTRTGDVVGTLDYIAPERIKGEADGPPSDIYALGCLLFYTPHRPGAVPARAGREQALGAPLRGAAAGPRQPGLRRRDHPRAGQGAGAALRERRGAGRRRASPPRAVRGRASCSRTPAAPSAASARPPAPRSPRRPRSCWPSSSTRPSARGCCARR